MPQRPSDVSEGVKDSYTTTELVSLIVSRIRLHSEDKRGAKDKVRKRLADAKKRGDLQPTPSGHYLALDVHPWMRAKWPGKFNDLYFELVGSGSASVTFTSKANCTVLPGDLPRCHKALQNADHEIRQLRDQLKRANAEIEELKPLAEKYRHICAKNSRSAKGPRNGLL